MSGHLPGPAGIPPTGVDALASFRTLRKRSTQATVGALSWAMKMSLLLLCLLFLSWEIVICLGSCLMMGGVSERGAVEGAGYQDLDGTSSRYVSTEAEGPMDVDTVYPQEAFWKSKRNRSH